MSPVVQIKAAKMAQMINVRRQYGEEWMLNGSERIETTENTGKVIISFGDVSLESSNSFILAGNGSCSLAGSGSCLLGGTGSCSVVGNGKRELLKIYCIPDMAHLR